MTSRARFFQQTPARQYRLTKHGCYHWGEPLLFTDKKILHKAWRVVTAIRPAGYSRHDTPPRKSRLDTIRYSLCVSFCDSISGHADINVEFIFRVLSPRARYRADRGTRDVLLRFRGKREEKRKEGRKKND